MKKKIVFTNGCFDILHRGHFELLAYCKSLGTVIVGLNSDESVTRLKGNTRPINNFDDRRFALESCRYVDQVVGFNEETPLKLIEDLRPDIIVKGGDYSESTVVGNEIAQVKIFRFVDDYSTTQIISRIVEVGVE